MLLSDVNPPNFSVSKNSGNLDSSVLVIVFNRFVKTKEIWILSASSSFQVFFYPKNIQKIKKWNNKVKIANIRKMKK